jgi:hypothetical protein
VLDEYGRTVDDLARARRHWRASGKKFVFDNDGDLMTFQAHMSALQSVRRGQPRRRPATPGRIDVDVSGHL